MSVRKWFRKTAQKAEQEVTDTAKDTGRAIDKTATDAADKASRLAQQADDKIRGKLMSVLDDVKNLANKAKQEIEGAANDAKNQIKVAANDAERSLRVVQHDIEGVAQKAKGEMETTSKQVVEAGKKVDDAAGALGEKVKEEVEALITHLTQIASGQVFRMALVAVKAFKSKADALRKSNPVLVKSIDKIGFKINLNILILKYSSFYSRADEIAGVLTKLAEHPPELRRSTITSAIVALAPSDLEPGAQLPFLPSGFSFPGVSNDLIAELLDTALEAAGVPE